LSRANTTYALTACLWQAGVVLLRGGEAQWLGRRSVAGGLSLPVPDL